MTMSWEFMRGPAHVTACGRAGAVIGACIVPGAWLPRQSPGVPTCPSDLNDEVVGVHAGPRARDGVREGGCGDRGLHCPRRLAAPPIPRRAYLPFRSQ